MKMSEKYRHVKCLTKSKFLSFVLAFGTVCNASPENATTHLKPNIKREFIDCTEYQTLLNPIGGAAIAGGITALAFVCLIVSTIKWNSDSTQVLQQALKFFPIIPVSMCIGGLAGSWHQENSKRIINAKTAQIKAYTELIKLEKHINTAH